MTPLRRASITRTWKIVREESCAVRTALRLPSAVSRERRVRGAWRGPASSSPGTRGGSREPPCGRNRGRRALRRRGEKLVGPFEDLNPARTAARALARERDRRVVVVARIDERAPFGDDDDDRLAGFSLLTLEDDGGHGDEGAQSATRSASPSRATQEERMLGARAIAEHVPGGAVEVRAFLRCARGGDEAVRACERGDDVVGAEGDAFGGGVGHHEDDRGAARQDARNRVEEAGELVRPHLVRLGGGGRRVLRRAPISPASRGRGSSPSQRRRSAWCAA